VLSAGGFVWTPRTLDAWLAAPFAFLPGNRMSFPGLSERQDRNELIAYLLQYTDSGIKAGTQIA
jgi:cytochrome c